jgi:hypothetical protein
MFPEGSFARTHGFHIHPESGSVNCGGNAKAAISGSATLLLKMRQGFRHRVKFYMTKLPQDLHVILGNNWLIAHCVLLNHATRTMETSHNGKTYQFSCPEVRSSIAGGTNR